MSLFNNSKKTKTGNIYPTLFIHGFVGWGENDSISIKFPYWGFGTEKALLPHLRSKGYEVYAPSLGPFTGAWDRCCELWAQLNGGTVDYGKVHSEKHGHPRFGRTYDKPLIPDFGYGKGHEKINIIGHSFGGPTVIEFSNLLINGCKEEIEGTPADELSQLFKGGNGDLLHTVTTLSGVNNGTTFASWLHSFGVKFIAGATLFFTSIVSDTKFTNKFDVRIDNWGLQVDPAVRIENKLKNPLFHLKKMKRYNDNKFDNIGYEMQIRYCMERNEHAVVNPSTYYFARTSCVSEPVKKGRHVVTDKENVSALCRGISRITGTSITRRDAKKYGVDETWLSNDGFVNTIAMRGPLSLPSKNWVGDENLSDVKSGIWYNFEPEYRDHISWMGMGVEKEEFFRYYEDMLNMFSELK